MKKFIVSFSFMFMFAVYSLYQYFGPSTSVTLTSKQQPVTVTKKTTPTSSNKTPPPVPVPVPVIAKKNMYNDGTFTGVVADAYYGNIQVQAIIQNGKIIDVPFLQYPNDRSNSIRINNAAMPILKSEAISAQNANVDIVSGATASSQAFQQSLDSALAQAKNF
jgi:uncharacterized protein with FMN-binding domain